MKIAATKAALDIYSESADTPDHQQRAIFAQAVLRQNVNFDPHDRIVWAVVADTSISGASTDQQLLDRVASCWNAFAV